VAYSATINVERAPARSARIYGATRRRKQQMIVLAELSSRCPTGATVGGRPADVDATPYRTGPDSELAVRRSLLSGRQP
jgi:hypothetical protein